MSMMALNAKLHERNGPSPLATALMEDSSMAGPTTSLGQDLGPRHPFRRERCGPGLPADHPARRAFLTSKRVSDYYLKFTRKFNLATGLPLGAAETELGGKGESANNPKKVPPLHLAHIFPSIDFV